MGLIKKLLPAAFFAALPAGMPLHAAEFEVLDRFSVDGYSVLRGSAAIPGGGFAVGVSTFVVKDGSVGIGTTAPDQKLAVNGSISQTGVLISSGTGNNYFAGNVGIGTAAPGAKLQISGNKAFSVYVDQGYDLTARYYPLGTFSSNNGEFKIDGILAGHVQSQGRVSANVTFAGREGLTAIGTAFGTFGSSDIVVYYDNAGTYTVYLKTGVYSLVNLDLTAVSGGSAVYNGTYVTSAPGGTLVYTLGADAGNVIRSTTGGNIGIGTTNPGAKLEVAGDIYINGNNVPYKKLASCNGAAYIQLAANRPTALNAVWADACGRACAVIGAGFSGKITNYVEQTIGTGTAQVCGGVTFYPGNNGAETVNGQVVAQCGCMGW